jgi:hypothetical protein
MFDGSRAQQYRASLICDFNSVTFSAMASTTCRPQPSRSLMIDLSPISVSGAIQRGQDHRFQDAARSRISRHRRGYRFRVASTSSAGVRSPVQLIKRGAVSGVRV